jgi:hypothetical protein
VVFASDQLLGKNESYLMKADIVKF